MAHALVVISEKRGGLCGNHRSFTISSGEGVDRGK